MRAREAPLIILVYLLWNRYSLTTRATLHLCRGGVSLLGFLESLSGKEDEEQVRFVRVQDNGSMSQCVKVQLQGVPVYGIIDSGANISIIGGELFWKVAHLRKEDCKKANKVPWTYE